MLTGGEDAGCMTGVARDVRWLRPAELTAVTAPVESKPRTAHQVTVYWSAAAFTKIRPPAVGSRSDRNSETRGGPVSSRATFRSVLALSSSSKVTFPSELTKAAVRGAL